MNNQKRSELLDISLDFMAGRDQEALNGARTAGVCNTDVLRTKAYANVSNGDVHALGVLVGTTVAGAAATESSSEEEGLLGHA